MDHRRTNKSDYYEPIWDTTGPKQKMDDFLKGMAPPLTLRDNMILQPNKSIFNNTNPNQKHVKMIIYKPMYKSLFNKYTKTQ